MRGGDAAVRRLARLVRLELNEPGTAYEWPAVEASLGGVSLPDDYKHLVEAFPNGRFQDSVRVIRPGDVNESPTSYLGYYSHRLQDMREARADEPERFPYPIFPEPGGLLPWGEGRRGDLFFWLTESADPNSWSVVHADVSWAGWSLFPGSMSEFLAELVSGRVEQFPYNSRVDRPVFVPRALRPPPPPLPKELYWDSMRQGRQGPQAELEKLSGALGALGAPSVTGRGKPGHAGGAGLRLPSDYSSFVDLYGHGTFCDIAILVPSGCGLHSIQKHADDRRRGLEDQGRSDPPIHPQPGGLIPWGRTREGWLLGWAPSDPDPDNWGVAAVSPGPRRVAAAYYEAESFTSFLTKYSGIDNRRIVLLGRRPWAGRLSFSRCREGE